MQKATNTPNIKEVKQGGIIDGRNQVVELLKALPIEERNTLLKHLKIKNPETANSLMEDSVSYNQIENLSDEHLTVLIRYISPQIFGIALKNSSKSLTQRILTLAPRQYAETAYQLLISFIDNGPQRTQVAQNKIIQSAIKLFGRNKFL